jgi:hypothetical protein
MKQLFITSLIFLIFPLFVFAQSANIGIIKGIWFSEDVFFAEDPIRIYTAIQNNSGKDIEGVVEFFDNDISIGKKNFTSLDKRVVELWMDTIITEGRHDYSVAITEAVINKPGEAKEPITPRIIVSDDTITAETDTDGDNIGDKEDLDDDNDGFSDIEEKKQGTDPMDKNSIPAPKESPSIVTENNLDTDSFLDTILAILRPAIDNTPNAIQETKEDTKTAIAVQPTLIAKPDFVQNIENSYPIIANVTTPLNTIQNNIVPNIIEERKNVINKIKLASVENKVPVEGINTNIDALAEYDHGLVGWQYWIWLIYSWILMGIQWIFSSLIFMILLIFISIHLLLKLLFRIFRSKNRIIS